MDGPGQLRYHGMLWRESFGHQKRTEDLGDRDVDSSSACDTYERQSPSNRLAVERVHLRSSLECSTISYLPQFVHRLRMHTREMRENYSVATISSGLAVYVGRAFHFSETHC
jgi:hypothetical protein